MIDPISATVVASKEVIAEILKESAELKIKESPLSQSLETIESTSLEALEAQNIENIENLKPYEEFSKIIDNKIDESLEMNRPYRRFEIDKEFNKVKSEMHQDAVVRGGDGNALYNDCYTGETLRGGQRYDYEHKRSSEEIFMKFRDQLTNHEIAEVVNCPENVSVTLRTINQSKGKMRMEDWMSKPNNISDYNIDHVLVEKELAKADIGIQNKVDEILSRKQ